MSKKELPGLWNHTDGAVSSTYRSTMGWMELSATRMYQRADIRLELEGDINDVEEVLRAALARIAEVKNV